MADADDDYFLAPQDTRVFGAGIKRKRVPFVPASSNNSDFAVSAPPSASQALSAGDRYLAIVLKQDSKKTTATADPVLPSKSETADSPQRHVLCPVCQQRLQPDAELADARPHESSITHQLCLEHSHPPSHLPREHVGLKYLEAYGWDPDSRVGLGARAEGIRAPVKTKVKNDTVGLGVDLEEERRKGGKRKDEEKVVMLNAKEVRKRDAEGRRRAEKLREKFYGPDLEQYLGPGG